MTDIFHEVEEDLRREQAKKLWRRFGPYVLIVAVLIVVATAGWRGWLWFREQQAAASGDRFAAALQLADDGKKDEALKALQDISVSGSGGYPILAQFRAAAEMAGSGKADDAVKAFDAIAANGATPPLLKAMARLRAAMLLVDGTDLPAMKTRIDDLAATGGPWRNSARELLGLVAWRTGDVEAARGYFTAISEDPSAPQSTKARANLMLELIRSKVGEKAAPPKT